jgi:hypothetical protein
MCHFAVAASAPPLAACAGTADPDTTATAAAAALRRITPKTRMRSIARPRSFLTLASERSPLSTYKSRSSSDVRHGSRQAGNSSAQSSGSARTSARSSVRRVQSRPGLWLMPAHIDPTLVLPAATSLPATRSSIPGHAMKMTFMPSRRGWGALLSRPTWPLSSAHDRTCPALEIRSACKGE